MNDLYENNLNHLKNIDVNIYKKILELEVKSAYVERSANGELNIVKEHNGMKYRVYSRINPTEMVKLIADNALSEESDVIFIFGLGLCYELKEILKKDDKKTYIIIEPDEEIFKVMLENVNIDFMINSSADIVFYVGKDLNYIMYMFENIINELKTLKIKFVISPTCKVIYYGLYQKIMEGLRLKLSRYVININSIDKYDKLWCQNFAKNLIYINDSVSVKNLSEVLNGIPAVICAAGSSISENLEKLKFLKQNVIIASVGSGISVLEASGIKAHIAGAMDGAESEAVLFKNLNVNKDVSLFYSLQVNSKVLEVTSKHKFLMNQTNMDSYVNKELKWNYYGQFSGSSIANVMAENLAKLGCNPIIFLGQDLCYSSNENYAKGAAFYSEIKNEEFEKKNEYVKIKNNRGEEVYTKVQFISMRDVMEKVILMNPNTEFLNGSKYGLDIKGARNIDFNAYYDKILYKREEIDFNSIIEEVYDKFTANSMNKEFTNVFLNKFEIALKKIILICKNIVTIIKSNYIIDIKEKYINDFEEKLEKIDFYNDVLKFSVENIEFLAPKPYLERKLNIYLYVLDKCYAIMDNM